MSSNRATQYSLTIPPRLKKHQQRATYGAVGGLAGMSGRGFGSFMTGLPHDHKNSWVVNKKTTAKAKRGYPTGYSPSQIDPDLTVNPKIIDDTKILRRWLRTHP